jgi:hypothetical protein
LTAHMRGADLRILGGRTGDPEMPRRDPAGYRQFLDLLGQLEVVYRETRLDWSSDNMDEAKSWLSRFGAGMTLQVRVKRGKN